MNHLTAPIVRVALIAAQTLRAARRQRAPLILGVLAAAFALGARGLDAFNFGESGLKFIADLGFGAAMLFGAVLTVVGVSQTFFAEIEHRTVLTLLAKPVRRGEVIAGQLLGALGLLAGFCIAMTLLVAAMLWRQELAVTAGHGGLVRYAAVAAIGLALWLKLAVLAAWTLLLASFARTALFATTLGLLVFVIGQLQHVMQTVVAHSGGAAARAGAWLLAWALPDFQRFDLAEALGHGLPLHGGDLGQLGVYAMGYTIAIGALAAWSFSHREL